MLLKYEYLVVPTDDGLENTLNRFAEFGWWLSKIYVDAKGSEFVVFERVQNLLGDDNVTLN